MRSAIVFWSWKRISYTIPGAAIVSIIALPATAQADFTPDWSKGIVWYQIFPECFSNGDPTNDPKVGNQNGAYPFDDTSALAFTRGPVTGTNFSLTRKPTGRIFISTSGDVVMAATCRA